MKREYKGDVIGDCQSITVGGVAPLRLRENYVVKNKKTTDQCRRFTYKLEPIFYGLSAAEVKVSIYSSESRTGFGIDSWT